jgi:TonB family protein
VIAGQEGSVTVQFTVDEAGRVTSVATTSASRWPLLNQAALRVIRQKWHFAPGVERSYEVVIQFQLER